MASLSSTQAAPPTAIRFDDVHLAFDEGEVLRGLSFEVLTGDTLVLLGETGAGKTLSLKVAAGLLRPAKGNVFVLGNSLETLSEKQLLAFRQEIGFVFQEGALFDSLTVAENVAFRLREEHLSEEETERRVREALRFVEMEHTLEMLPSELSGGMRRRVSIARALISRPPIVLYDSPTAGLDPVTSQTIIALILRLRDIYGVTAILATQRLQDGFALANFRFDAQSNRVESIFGNGHAGSAQKLSATRFAVLRGGTVYFQGEPGELAETKDAYLQRFLI
jgi:phospholipid/cholesterol/gamma-HCH transport system ATP-binding protein